MFYLTQKTKNFIKDKGVYNIEEVMEVVEVSGIRIGFLEEFDERNAIRKKLKNATWGRMDISTFVNRIKNVDEDIAEVMEEKSKELDVKYIEHTRVSIEDKTFDVYYDGKNYIVVAIDDTRKVIQKDNKSKVISTKSVPNKSTAVSTEGREDVKSDNDKELDRRKKNRRKKGEKTRIVLEYLEKYLQMNGGETKIGPFYRYLREKGIDIHRPQVFNIVKKYCNIEYTQTKGGRKEIVIKGISV